MEVSYRGDKRTGRVTHLTLDATSAADELWLTAVMKVLKDGTKGERLTVRYRAEDGMRRLSWLPERKKPKGG